MIDISTVSAVYLSYIMNYQKETFSKKVRMSLDKLLFNFKPFLFDSIYHFSDLKGNKKALEGCICTYKNKTYVLFMASNSFQDWLVNFLFFKKKVPYNNVKKNIKVHSGYLNRYKLNSIRTNILFRLINDSYPKDLVVCGYSMGGGIAPICAVDIAKNLPNFNVHCVSLAGPRVGNKNFVDSLDKYVEAKHYSYGNDPVVKVPPRFFGFRHINKTKHFGEKQVWWKFRIKDHYPEHLFNYCQAYLHDLII